jgi:hypothetical protein
MKTCARPKRCSKKQHCMSRYCFSAMKISRMLFSDSLNQISDMCFEGTFLMLLTKAKLEKVREVFTDPLLQFKDKIDKSIFRKFITRYKLSLSLFRILRLKNYTYTIMIFSNQILKRPKMIK